MSEIMIRNWDTFQHFKDRNPPWIKLHKTILDQHDISVISDCSFRVLIGLWLLASEDKNRKGILPSIPQIAFRLRIKEEKLMQCLQELKEFLIFDDISVISGRYQVDVPETETEAYKQETEKPLSGKKKKKPDQFALENFEALWSLYPEKVGKKEAQRHFNATVKTEADVELIKTALQNYIAKVESDRDAGRDRPWQNGSTFFNNWRDWLDYKPPQAKPETPDDGLAECLNCATQVPRRTLDGYSICETCINGGR